MKHCSVATNEPRIYWILVMKCVQICIHGYHLLLLALVTGYNIVEGLSTCPTDKVIEERAEAAEVVHASVRCVLSKVLNDFTITNDSLSDKELYEHMLLQQECLQQQVDLYNSRRPSVQLLLPRLMHVQQLINPK